MIEYLTVKNIVVLGMILLFSYGCIAKWPTTATPPVVVNPIMLAEDLYDLVEPKLKESPAAAAVFRKVILEVRSKLPLIQDGRITVNDAFVVARSATPDEYKIYITGMKLLFNTFVGDIGKAMPNVVKEKVDQMAEIITVFEKRLGGNS